MPSSTKERLSEYFARRTLIKQAGAIAARNNVLDALADPVDNIHDPSVGDVSNIPLAPNSPTLPGSAPLTGSYFTPWGMAERLGGWIANRREKQINEETQ